VAYGLIIIGIVMLYIRIRVRRLIRQRKILEERVLQRTAQIERQKQELQKLNSTKDRFFSIIAHDLRSPFNTILGFTDLLLADYKSYDAGKVEKYLFYIKDAARHTFELLQNLLLWARSQTGALEYHPAPFDLKERIEESILLVRSQADKKNIRTFHEIPGQAMAVGDKNMIDTVLRNFLTNAIKFTPKGGNVSVLVREIDSRWEIVIRDSGIGIASENIDKIFRIDSKFTTRGTEEEHGTGLGLVLCREFIERHGSTIRVQSEPGKGSEFSFTLGKE
jgi:signal transduction histidine kinase